MAIVTTCKRSVQAHAIMCSMDGGSAHRTSSLAHGDRQTDSAPGLSDVECSPMMLLTLFWLYSSKYLKLNGLPHIL